MAEVSFLGQIFQGFWIICLVIASVAWGLIAIAMTIFAVLVNLVIFLIKVFSDKAFGKDWY